MKNFIVICLVLLAVPTMAMADFRADRAELMAGAGLFNIAALDNPKYADVKMESDTSRGRTNAEIIAALRANVLVATDTISSFDLNVNNPRIATTSSTTTYSRRP